MKIGQHDSVDFVEGKELQEQHGRVLVRPGKGLMMYEARIGRRYYRCMWQRCAKRNCWCSDPVAREFKKRQGHGPYWYWMIRNGERWIKKYLGKNLMIDGRQILLIGQVANTIERERDQVVIGNEGWNLYDGGDGDGTV